MYDVLIIGAGPAGIAAACAAAEGTGASVAIVDDNKSQGGQIWREGPHDDPSHKWISRFRKLSVDKYFGYSLIAGSKNAIRVESMSDAIDIGFKKLIIATGARELFLPFPGWTSPKMVGVGGLEAMCKGGLDVKGKRILIAGSGPLLIAAASNLKSQWGANVLMIAEQAPLLKVAKFASTLIFNPDKIIQGIVYKWTLLGVRSVFSAYPVRADEVDHSLRVTMQIGQNREQIDCDLFACAFGLVPNVEPALLMGCDLDEKGHVKVSANQQTRVENIYAAGELTGIGGADKSLVEGTIAGLVCAGKIDEAVTHFTQRRHAIDFMDRLERGFKLREELKTLADDQTIICRCECVRLGDLKDKASSRDAKLQTRCGMGRCQGRICGPILGVIKGWNDVSVRPPVTNARMGSLLNVEADLYR